MGFKQRLVVSQRDETEMPRWWELKEQNIKEGDTQGKNVLNCRPLEPFIKY